MAVGLWQLVEGFPYIFVTNPSPRVLSTVICAGLKPYFFPTINMNATSAFTRIER
jgi:hypothetical protein